MTTGTPTPGARGRVPKFGDLRTRRRAELRAAILADARAIIADDGVDALSMRGLAQRIGCAPMTLYSYFDDKHALLLALAHESFATLAVRLARYQPDDPLEALRNVYREYVRFGLQRPDDYRTIFMTPESEPPRERKTASGIHDDNPAFAVSMDRVRACLAAGRLVGDAHSIATVLWTAAHGAVSAILTFPAFPFGDPAAYAARVVDLTISAIRAEGRFEPL